MLTNNYLSVIVLKIFTCTANRRKMANVVALDLIPVETSAENHTKHVKHDVLYIYNINTADL